MTAPKLQITIPSPAYSNNLILFDTADTINEKHRINDTVSINRSIALQYQLKKRPKYTSSRLKQQRNTKPAQLLIESATHKDINKESILSPLRHTQSKKNQHRIRPKPISHKSINPPHYPFPSENPPYLTLIKLKDKNNTKPHKLCKNQKLKSKSKSTQSLRVRSPHKRRVITKPKCTNIAKKRPETVSLTVDCQKSKSHKNINEISNNSVQHFTKKEFEKKIRVQIPAISAISKISVSKTKTVKVTKPSCPTSKQTRALRPTDTTHTPHSHSDCNRKVLIALGKPMTIPHLKGKWNDLLPNVFPASSPQNSRPISARTVSKNNSLCNSPKRNKHKKLQKSQSSVQFCSLINNQNVREGISVRKKITSPLNDPSFCKIKQIIHQLSKSNVRSLESLHRSINRARSVPSNKLTQQKIGRIHSLRKIGRKHVRRQPGQRPWN